MKNLNRTMKNEKQKTKNENLKLKKLKMNKDNYRCISSGRVHSSKCKSSPHSPMV